MALKAFLLRDGGQPVGSGEACAWSMRVPAMSACLPMLRTGVWSFLAGRLDDGEVIHRIGFAVYEAVNNAVLHAYPDGPIGQVDVSVMFLGSEVEAVIRDYGVGIQREVAPKRRVGIPLMVAMASRLEISDGAPGTIVRQRFRLDTAGDGAGGRVTGLSEVVAVRRDRMRRNR